MEGVDFDRNCNCRLLLWSLVGGIPQDEKFEDVGGSRSAGRVENSSNIHRESHICYRPLHFAWRCSWGTALMTYVGLLRWWFVTFWLDFC